MNGRFLNQTEIGVLKALLINVRGDHITEEEKLKAISGWLNTPSPAVERVHRINYFEELHEILGFNKMSAVSLLDLVLGQDDFELSRPCKPKLLDVWKSGQVIPPKIEIPSLGQLSIDSYAACLPSFLTCKE